jgi:glycosyltransferase involved in cell wall biosynthesis
VRIAIVSAHYPPNFVSGGTLVPQRIARQLAGRGHSVFVFAGEILPGEPDLLTRVDHDADIEVTWVSVAGRLKWEHRENFDSVAVQGAFLDFLRRVRPDVVHLHTLQGLGGGLVALAAAAGAATVVTMHDMWWWCARQFLVQEDLTPCTVVVQAGVCPCSVDNDWLQERNAELAAHLAAADLVLAPSTPMLRLLAANGVDPAKLALDENPSPDAVRHSVSRPPRAPGSDVRFVFAGGPFPLKGPHRGGRAR